MLYYTDSPLRLEPILEENEYSSQSSLHKCNEKQDLSFSNPAAIEMLSDKSELISGAENSSFDFERNLSFSNKTALEMESNELSEEESSAHQIPDVITTTFNSMSLVGKINRKEELGNGLHPPSPLLNYSPRSSLIPPDEVEGNCVHGEKLLAIV